MPTNDASSRDRILAYLQAQGGSITSEEGRGLTQAIASAAGYTDLSVLNGMLSRLEREGMIQRDIRGRRTYRIALAGAAGARRRATGARRSAASSRRGERAASAPGRPPGVAPETEETVRRLDQDVTRLAARLARLEAEVADMDRMVARAEQASRAQPPQPPAPAPARRGLFGRR